MFTPTHRFARLSPFVVVVLLVFAFLAVIRLIQLHCFSYYDLGIYSEALARIRLADLNPFIPGRNIRIFNDHFDPILIPFAFLTPLVSAPYLGVALEFLSVGLCWFPIQRLFRNGILSRDQAVFAYAFLTLNQASVAALTWPFHPTTFGVLPLVCVFCFYLLNKSRALVVSFLILCLCREEFPLIGLPLAGVLFVEKKNKPAIAIMLISLLFLIFLFGLRPIWFEHTSTYGQDLLRGFLSQPFAQLKELVKFGSIRMWAERLSPLLLLLSFRSVRANLAPMFKMALIASPILGIRYASNQWGFHYGTAAVIAIFFCFFAAFRDSTVKPWRQHLAWALILVFFLSPTVKNLWDAYIPSSMRFAYKQCPLNPERLSAIARAQTWIAQSRYQRILMQNNLAPTQIIKASSKSIYLLAGPQNDITQHYDVILVEKPPLGDAWRIGHDRIASMIDELKKNAEVHVVQDDVHVFLAEGKIPSDR